jgi:hypothetical protein
LYFQKAAKAPSAAPGRAVGGKAVETSLKTFYKEFRKVLCLLLKPLVTWHITTEAL